MSAPGVRGQTFDEKGELPPGWKTKVDPAKKRLVGVAATQLLH